MTRSSTASCRSNRAKGPASGKTSSRTSCSASRGHGKLEPSDHVLSLGKGGKITLEFVDNEVIDEEGPDFIIFENAFLKAPGDDPGNGFFELAKVEVSADGQEWKKFEFDAISRKGCAGWHPVLANPEENDIDPTDPEKAGGDAFDLKEVGLKMIRFVRITDLDNTTGANGMMGFDLDAVAAVHSHRARKTKANENTGRFLLERRQDSALALLSCAAAQNTPNTRWSRC